MAVTHTDRGFDRLVNFSDAVVAIAITLLVLPLTDLVEEYSREAGNVSVWDMLGADDNAYRFTAFAVTFAVTAIFWMVHHRVFEYLGDYDAGLVWLNTLWLALVVMLPFSSGVVSAGGFEGGAGFLYCSTMALLSSSLGLITLYARHHPHLLAEGISPENLRTNRSWILAGAFAVIGVLSLWIGDAASWLMLLFIPLERLLKR